MIIGAEEGPGHHFVHGEEAATTYPTIFSPSPLHQEGTMEGATEGAIIIEKEHWGVREHSDRLAKGGGKRTAFAAFSKPTLNQVSLSLLRTMLEHFHGPCLNKFMVFCS